MFTLYNLFVHQLIVLLVHAHSFFKIFHFTTIKENPFNWIKDNEENPSHEICRLAMVNNWWSCIVKCVVWENINLYLNIYYMHAACLIVSYTIWLSLGKFPWHFDVFFIKRMGARWEWYPQILSHPLAHLFYLFLYTLYIFMFHNPTNQRPIMLISLKIKMQ